MMDKKYLASILAVCLISLSSNAFAEKLRSTPFVIPTESDVKKVNFDASALQESNISRAIITNRRVLAQSILTTEWLVYSLEDFNERFEAIQTHASLNVSKRNDGVGPYEMRRDGNLLSTTPIFIVTGDPLVDAVASNGNLGVLQDNDYCQASAGVNSLPLFTQVYCERKDYQSFTKNNWVQTYDYTTIDRLELGVGPAYYSPTTAICGRLEYVHDDVVGGIDQKCSNLDEYPYQGNNYTSFTSSEQFSLLPAVRGDVEIHTKMLYPRDGLNENGNYIGITCSQYSTEQRTKRFRDGNFLLAQFGRMLGFQQLGLNQPRVDESVPICSISYKAGANNANGGGDNGFEFTSNNLNNALFDDLRLTQGNLKLSGQRDIDSDNLSNIILSFGRYRGIYIVEMNDYNFKMLVNTNLSADEVIEQYSTQVYEKVD